MTEQLKSNFLDYSLSKRLEKLGFKEECLATIDQTEYIHIKGNKQAPRGSMIYDTIHCPLFSQALDWFREKYGYLYSITRIYSYKNEDVPELLGYCNFIGGENPNQELECNKFFLYNYYSTYQEARQACLEQLIKIVEDEKDN